jgi:hypothetical protein
MIPGNLYRYGDKRALSYAKQYFKMQLDRKDGAFSTRAAKYLMVLGWDDPESIQIFVDGVHRLGKPGSNLFGSALSGFPKKEEMPIELRREMIRAFAETAPRSLQVDNVLEFWSRLVAHARDLSEILEVINLFRSHIDALDDKSNCRLMMSLFVGQAVDRYPLDRPMPEAMLDALESMLKLESLANARSDSFSDDAWGIRKTQLLGAISDRRRRSRSLAPVGRSDLNPASSPVPVSCVSPSSEGSGGGGSSRQINESVASRASSWIRIALAGLVVLILAGWVVTLLLRRARRHWGGGKG